MVVVEDSGFERSDIHHLVRQELGGERSQLLEGVGAHHADGRTARPVGIGNADTAVIDFLVGSEIGLGHLDRCLVGSHQGNQAFVGSAGTGVLGRRTDVVVGKAAQLVGHLDGRHEAGVEHEEVEMGRPFKDRYQLGDIHAMVTVRLVLPRPTGRSLTVGDPPVGMRPVNQAITFGLEIGIGKYVGKDFACLVHAHRVAVVVGAHHVFHHLSVLFLQFHKAGRAARIDVDEQMEHTVGYLCHAFLHFSQVFQRKGRKIVVGSQIDQHRPLVGRCLGLIVFVTGRQQKGKQKKGEQEPMFHRRILH